MIVTASSPLSIAGRNSFKASVNRQIVSSITCASIGVEMQNMLCHSTTESSVISSARSTISSPSINSSFVIHSGGLTKKLFQRTKV